MKDSNTELNNPGCENRDGMEDGSSGNNPGSEQHPSASVRSMGAHNLRELRTQNISTLRGILEDLLAGYEVLNRSTDDESSARAHETLRDIRLVMKLLDSLINSLQNPKNGAIVDALLTEDGALAFGACVETFLLDTNRFVRQELFSDDPDRAEKLLSHLASDFDDAFQAFGTRSSVEED